MFRVATFEKIVDFFTQERVSPRRAIGKMPGDIVGEIPEDSH